MGDPGSIPGSGRSPGERNGNPLQCSCLENPIDRGAWWAIVHGVTELDMTERLHFTSLHFTSRGHKAWLTRRLNNGETGLRKRKRPEVVSPSRCWRTEARGCQRSSVHPPAIPLLAFCSLTSIHRATCKASRGEGTTAEKKTAVPGSADWSSSPRERKCIHDLREVGLPFPLPSASALSRTQSTPEDLRPSHSALSERRPSPRIPADLRASRKVSDPALPESASQTPAQV